MDDSFIKLLESDGQAEKPRLDIYDGKNTISSLSFLVLELGHFHWWRDDVSMDDSFIKLLESDGQAEEPRLDIYDGKTEAFFNWRSAPVENRTQLENRTATLGYRIARCTTLGSLGLLDSNQLSELKIQTLVLHPQYFHWERTQKYGYTQLLHGRGLRP